MTRPPMKELCPGVWHLPEAIQPQDRQELVDVVRDGAVQAGMPQVGNAKVCSFGPWWTPDGYEAERLKLPVLILRIANQLICKVPSLSEYVPFMPVNDIRKFGAIARWYDPGTADSFPSEDGNTILLSIGAGCLFQVGEEETPLLSGDAVIFTGKCPGYGFPELLPDSDPYIRLKPGRLNITVRRVVE